MHRRLNHGVVLAGLLAAVPACLNPDISDEYPLTMQAEALDGDAGSDVDEPADEAALVDDAEPADDRASPDARARAGDTRTRPRRDGAGR